MSNVAEQVKKHFDEGPYPDVPISEKACCNLNDLYNWSLITPFYRKYQKIISTEGLQVLDVGCGSGYVAQKLVEANPGITLTGVDLSPKSIEVAQARFDHHGYRGHRFIAMSAEDLPQLGQTFDYINCHETLYLLPDPLAGLKAMKSVLREGGIIRANVHSFYQRQSYFRIQELFRFLGVMDDCSLKTSIELVRTFLDNLQDFVSSKAVWDSSSKRDEVITANMILQGDKGFTIPSTFALLEAADLEFVSMVNWQFWNVAALFKDARNLPEEFTLLLESATEPELLHLYELIHPANRLIDFWCSHPDGQKRYTPASVLSPEQWWERTVQVNPVLQDLRFAPNIDFRKAILDVINDSRLLKLLPLNKIFSATSPGEVTLPEDSCLLLYHLWAKPLPFPELVEIWAKLRPVHYLTLQPQTPAEVAEGLIPMLAFLEDRSLILVT